MTETPGRRAASVAAFIARLAAGAVLSLSGYLKAIRPVEEMMAVLDGYWILPAWLTPAVARVVPWLELWVGLALLTGYLSRLAAVGGGALFAGFIVFLAQSIVRGLNLKDCGCFGELGPHLTPTQSLTLDAVMLLFCVLVFFDRRRLFSLDRWIEAPNR